MTPEELAAEYDRQYLATRVRYGPRSGELDWRLEQLLWRQKALLRWFPFAGLDVLDYGCMDGVFSYAMARARRGARRAFAGGGVALAGRRGAIHA